MSILTGEDPIAVARHKFGIVEFVRSNAYARLNDIGDCFGKKVPQWTRLAQAKEYIEAFKADRAYGQLPPIIVAEGRNINSVDAALLKQFGVEKVRTGTWAHPDVVIEFARWCSPAFGLWCNRQIRHLLQYGEVNLHYTKWSQEEYEQGLEYNRQDWKEIRGGLY